MAVLGVCLVLLLHSLVSSSDANYCVCNTGQSDSVLQKNIDFACGHGADCSAIQPNGACYNPNSVKDHCSYAVNSYYQKKGQTADSCNFQGTATVSSTAPSGGSGCTFQSSSGGTSTPPSGGGTTQTPSTGGTTPTTPSTGGTTTPSTSPTIGGTPTTPSTGGINSPSTSPGFGGTTTPSTGGTSTPGVFPGTSTGTGIPTSSPFGNTDTSSSLKLSSTSCTTVALAALSVALVAYDFIHPRM